MNYIVQFDIAGAFLLAVVGVLFYSKKYFPSPSNSAFSVLLLNLFISTIMDIISVYTIAHADTFPLFLNYIINILYFITFNCCSILYIFYTVTLLKIENTKTGKVVSGILLALMGFIFVFAGSSPWTKVLFYFENGLYYRGWGIYIMIPLGVVMMGASIVMCFLARKKLSKQQLLSTFIFVIFITLAIMIQINDPNVLLVNFVSSVMVLLIYQTLQNPSDYVNTELGVYNQHAFLEMLDRQIQKNRKFTVLAFQLEGFQFVDQFMGTDNGNQLLTAVAKDCSDHLKGKLYHIEGTQFAMIMEADSPIIQDSIEWLNWRFLSTFKVCGVAVSLIPRICAVQYPQIAKSREEMLNAIIYAFQVAKDKNSTDVVWATTEAIEEQKRNTMVAHILNRAVRNREFEVYYQPIYCTRDKSFRAAEALIRLRDAELGFISPEEFIPLAEKNGLILEIGDIVFEEVCKFVASGVPSACGVQYIEVNLSVVQCMQENLHHHLTSMMDKHQIPYHMIDFEITETFATGDTGTLVKNMTELIALGCTFAMDDYGTGFSNTDYLMEFPFKLIKLDKSFVWSTLSNEKARKILSHTVSMIKSLELLIVAEGVETLEQAQMLEDLKCDYLQGYYYSKPLPQEEYVGFLKNVQHLLAETESNKEQSKPKKRIAKKASAQ